MNQAQVVRLVVASPSDVQAERDALAVIVDELNRGIAADRGLVLRLIRWETDAHPGFHPEGPQGLIDPILNIEESDIVIGIFWKRFGTPTKDAGSGTEHEIKKAYEAWKRQQRPQVMVYFNQKPYTPKTKQEIEQWGKVIDFRDQFPKEGLWWEYKGKAQFERLVRNHLTQVIRSYELKDKEPTAEEQPSQKQVERGSDAWNVPYERNQFFTGRIKELKELRKSLTSNKAAVVNQAQAICGLGGIGKTQLAVEYAYKYKRQYSAVLWVRAESETEIQTGYSEIAK